MPVLGAIPRTDELAVPSRHLGLVTAAEHGVRASGRRRDGRPGGPPRRPRAVVPRQPRTSMRRRGPEPSPTRRRGRHRGGRGGQAFSFGYPEHAELLPAAGAESSVRSADRTLAGGHRRAGAPRRIPRRVRAELSANEVVRQRPALAATGAPIHAECAGLTYLVDDLDGTDVRGAVRLGALHRPAHAGLSRRRRRRIAAARCGHACHRPRIPPHGSDVHASTNRHGRSGGRRGPPSPTASSTRACTRPTHMHAAAHPRPAPVRRRRGTSKLAR